MKYLLFFLISIASAVHLPSAACAQQAPPLTITLEEGLRLALERNEILRIAREDLGKSSEQVREATADAFPQINLSLDYTRNWQLPSFIFDTPQGRQTVTVGTRNNVNGILSLRQPLYTGGKVGSALKVARSFADLSREALRGARQQVWADVETAFYDLLLARDLVRVSRLALERAKTNLKRVQNLRTAGRASDYDLLRAEVQVSERRPDSIRAANGLILARTVFKNSVGIDQDRPLKVSGSLQRQANRPLDRLEDLIQSGLASRPEMRQLEHQVQMRRQAIGIARASSRPSLDLLINGQVQIQSNRWELNRDDVRNSWFSGLSVAIPLFDGFRTGAKVAQARTDLRRAQLEAERLERAIRLQVRQAWLVLKEAGERTAAQENAMRLARRGLEIAESRYAGGLGTQLEVMDAQLSLLRAEIEYARAQRDRAVSLVELERAMGVLGEPYEDGGGMRK